MRIKFTIYIDLSILSLSKVFSIVVAASSIEDRDEDIFLIFGCIKDNTICPQVST